MPKLYTVRDMIKAWDEAYGEDLREEEGFLSILRRHYGKEPRSTRSRSQRRTTGLKPSEMYFTGRKRKLTAWNKYVKANSSKPRFKYKSGANKGRLNLKKMAAAFKKTPAGKKKK